MEQIAAAQGQMVQRKETGVKMAKNGKATRKQPNDLEKMPVESNISKAFTEKTTKVVIILILSTLFILPFFEITTYFNYKSSFENGFYQLIDVYRVADTNKDASLMSSYEKGVDFYIDDRSSHELPLFRVKLPGRVKWEDESLSDFRSDEYGAFDGDFDSEGFYDIRLLVKIDAIINIARTLMVCVMLGLASYYFNKDAQRMVLAPIERMMEKVNIIAKNPMALCSDEDLDQGILATINKKSKKQQ